MAISELTASSLLADGRYAKEVIRAINALAPSVLVNGTFEALDSQLEKPSKQEETASTIVPPQSDKQEETASTPDENSYQPSPETQKDNDTVSTSRSDSTPAIAPVEHKDTPTHHEKNDEPDMAAKTEAVPVAADDTIPPPPKTNKELAEMVMKILDRYRIAARNGSSPPYMAYTNFLTMIEERINLGEPIHMVLPAFPFKSPNKVTKVLGDLPDQAEEVALKHLEGLCLSVEEVYKGGCFLEIVSDGISYNDLLGVSDEEVWKYGQAVRQICIDNGCTHIRFARLRDLLGISYDPEGSAEQYLENVPEYRNELYRANIPEGFDPSALIASDPDVAMTYRGYVKFLEKDLEFTDAYDRNVSNSQIKKRNERVAKQMIGRGKAFATAIAKKYPNSVRLSIHPSGETTKLSISLLPQVGACTMTPWHSSLVRAVDGSIQLSHALRVPALTHDLIFENGRPSYFREKSPLFDWPGMDVEFQYMYPCGILIKPRDKNSRYSLHNVHMQKVRKLAEYCSPIVLRGFEDTNDRRTFVAKAYDAGEVLPWTFGVLQEVKDAGRKDRMANNVVSSEAMPMHYDGMFKFVKKIAENGKETSVSIPPRFQYFTAKSPSPPGCGYTLFASSRLFFQFLPKPYTVEEISKVTWDCKNSGFWDNHMTNLPLVVPHPANGTPCVRWHQPWPQWKTKFAFCKINIENASQDIIPLVDSLLYDRRVCLYFTWEKGDVLVNDNFSMLHTRTAFEGDSDRELWRIHFD